jgi:hypothetical protein
MLAPATICPGFLVLIAMDGSFGLLRFPIMMLGYWEKPVRTGRASIRKGIIFFIGVVDLNFTKVRKSSWSGQF